MRIEFRLRRGRSYGRRVRCYDLVRKYVYVVVSDE